MSGTTAAITQFIAAGMAATTVVATTVVAILFITACQDTQCQSIPFQSTVAVMDITIITIIAGNVAGNAANCPEMQRTNYGRCIFAAATQTVDSVRI